MAQPASENEFLSVTDDDSTKSPLAQVASLLSPMAKAIETKRENLMSKLRKKREVIESDKRTRTESQEQVFSLEVIESDKRLYKAFREYMDRSLKLENILFLESLDKFHKLETENEGEIDEHIRSIYRKYVMWGADYEINVQGSYRTAVKYKVEDLNNLSVAEKRELFFDCEGQIRDSVKGCINFFVKEREFREYKEFKPLPRRTRIAHKLKSGAAQKFEVLKNLKIQRNKNAVDEPPTHLSLNNDDSKDDCKDDAFEVRDNVNNVLDSPSPSPHDQRLDVSLTPYDSMTPDSHPMMDVGAKLANADTSSEEEKKEESPDDQDLDHNTGGLTLRPYFRRHAMTERIPQHFDEAYSGDNASGSHAYAQRIQE